MGALLGSSQRGRDHFASRRHHRTSDGEEGFTLIELLIVLVILPLVVGAIAMVLITTLKNHQAIQGNVTDSSAATLSSSYYVRDIESASSVTTNPSAASPAPCSAGSLSGASLLLGLQLEGTQPTEVSYYSWTPPSGGPPQLVREFLPERVIDPAERRDPFRQHQFHQPFDTGRRQLHYTDTPEHPDRSDMSGHQLDTHVPGIERHAQRHPQCRSGMLGCWRGLRPEPVHAYR